MVYLLIPILIIIAIIITVVCIKKKKKSNTQEEDCSKCIVIDRDQGNVNYEEFYEIMDKFVNKTNEYFGEKVLKPIENRLLEINWMMGEITEILSTNKWGYLIFATKFLKEHNVNAYILSEKECDNFEPKKELQYFKFKDRSFYINNLYDVENSECIVINSLQEKVGKKQLEYFLEEYKDVFDYTEYKNGDFENSYKSGYEFILLTHWSREWIRKIYNILDENNISATIKKTNQVNLNLVPEERSVKFLN